MFHDGKIPKDLFLLDSYWLLEVQTGGRCTESVALYRFIRQQTGKSLCCSIDSRRIWSISFWWIPRSQSRCDEYSKTSRNKLELQRHKRRHIDKHGHPLNLSVQAWEDPVCWSGPSAALHVGNKNNNRTLISLGFIVILLRIMLLDGLRAIGLGVWANV